MSSVKLSEHVGGAVFPLVELRRVVHVVHVVHVGGGRRGGEGVELICVVCGGGWGGPHVRGRSSVGEIGGRVHGRSILHLHVRGHRRGLRRGIYGVGTVRRDVALLSVIGIGNRGRIVEGRVGERSVVGERRVVGERSVVVWSVSRLL